MKAKKPLPGEIWTRKTNRLAVQKKIICYSENKGVVYVDTRRGYVDEIAPDDFLYYFEYP